MTSWGKQSGMLVTSFRGKNHQFIFYDFKYEIFDISTFSKFWYLLGVANGIINIFINIKR